MVSSKVESIANFYNVQKCEYFNTSDPIMEILLQLKTGIVILSSNLESDKRRRITTNILVSSFSFTDIFIVNYCIYFQENKHFLHILQFYDNKFYDNMRKLSIYHILSKKLLIPILTPFCLIRLIWWYC
jgi:hypothetical protein